MTARDEKPEKLRIDHVERAPLPWRDAELTECGLPLEGHPTITRASYEARLREWGRERTAWTICRTCGQTAGRWKPWSEDPVSAIQREAERHGYYHSGNPARELFLRELRALAALAEAHQDEFNGYVQGLTETVSLADARKARKAR